MGQGRWSCRCHYRVTIVRIGRLFPRKRTPRAARACSRYMPTMEGLQPGQHYTLRAPVLGRAVSGDRQCGAPVHAPSPCRTRRGHARSSRVCSRSLHALLPSYVRARSGRMKRLGVALGLTAQTTTGTAVRLRRQLCLRRDCLFGRLSPSGLAPALTEESQLPLGYPCVARILQYL